MNFEKLKEVDTSLEIYKDNSFSGNISKITTVEQLKNDTLVFVKDNKFLKKLTDGVNAAEVNNLCVITSNDIAQKIEEEGLGQENISLIATTKDVTLSLCSISKVFYDEMVETFEDFNDGRETSNIDPTAQIAPNVFIGKNVEIGKNVKIYSGCSILSFSKIGDNTVLYPNVVVYQNVKIGQNCRIHSTTTIGSDGFGYQFDSGVHHKIWHMGGVVIGDNVEIGSATAVDCGTFVPTYIGSGCKIDNGVQIAHNCNVKNGAIFCGHSALSGSCSVGNYVVFGGKSGSGPDVDLGDGCQVAGGALISKSWPAGTKLAGHPARPIKEWFRANAFVQNGAKVKK